VQGNGASNWSTLKALNGDWIAQKKVLLILQWGLQPHPDLAGVPMVLDLAKSESDRQALRLAVGRLEFGRPFFLPPNVPAARVEALRRAFDATMKDPAFLAEAQKAGMDISPAPGELAQGVAASIANTPPAVLARAKAILEN
jgi:hypothetical protein